MNIMACMNLLSYTDSVLIWNYGFSKYGKHLGGRVNINPLT